MALQTENVIWINCSFHGRYRHRWELFWDHFHSRCRHSCSLQFWGGRATDGNNLGHTFRSRYRHKEISYSNYFRYEFGQTVFLLLVLVVVVLLLPLLLLLFLLLLLLLSFSVASAVAEIAVPCTGVNTPNQERVFLFRGRKALVSHLPGKGGLSQKIRFFPVMPCRKMGICWAETLVKKWASGHSREIWQRSCSMFQETARSEFLQISMHSLFLNVEQSWHVRGQNTGT